MSELRKAAQQARQMTVRWLKPGEVFVLLRTGELFEYMARDINTPGGIRHCVRRVMGKQHTTLHHSCHVRVVRES